MLKIVPDPPYTLESHDYLEDTLAEAMEYILCLTVANQSITVPPKSSAAVLALAITAASAEIEHSQYARRIS